MKLKNLLFGTMVACAFVACSNDDDPTPGPDVNPAELDASLTVAFVADGTIGTRATTKAIGNSEASDAGFQKIAIAVFNNGAMSPAIAQDALISYRVIDRNGADTTACVSAKSGDVKVVVVANPAASDLEDCKTLSDFQTAISKATLASQANGNLLMASKVYGLKLNPGKNIACSAAQKTGDKAIKWSATDIAASPNWLTTDEGYKVYRNVAKVVLGKITVQPREDFGEKANYAKFILDSVYIDHARRAVCVFGDNTNAWNSVNIKGLKDAKEDYRFLTGRNGSTASLLDLSKKGEEAIYGTGGKSIDVQIPFYVFDNAKLGEVNLGTGIATRLVVKGTYEYKTGNSKDETLVSEDAYWYFEVNNGSVVAVNENGAPTHRGVLRNVEYTVNMTITGPGEPKLPNPTDPTDPEDPDKPVTPENPDGKAACVKVAVAVAPWGKIVQNPDID